MKALLARLFRMFHSPEPTKPVEPWPFPTPEAIEKAKKAACKPAKKTVKTAAKKHGNRNHNKQKKSI